MTSRLLAIVAWLTGGHAVLFGLYWLLLSVPESNIAMLSASAVAIAAALLVFGWVEGLGLLAWRDELTLSSVPRRAVGAIPAVWMGAVLFVATWFLVAHGANWWHAHRGETDAWLMLHFGVADTTRFHAVVGWLFTFLAYVVGLSLALALAAVSIVSSPRAVVRSHWIRSALSLRRLAVLTAILAVFFWLPWQSVHWRPRGLAPNWQETVFVSVKLGVIYLLANVGWALALGTTRKDT
jgi:hypothetical protein